MMPLEMVAQWKLAVRADPSIAATPEVLARAQAPMVATNPRAGAEGEPDLIQFDPGDYVAALEANRPTALLVVAETAEPFVLEE